MGYSSSINTGLQQTPDLTDIQSIGKLSFEFIQLHNAVGILAQAIDSYTGNAPPSQASSVVTTPAENTVLVGNTSNFYCKSTGTINAGFLVTLGVSGGATTATLANAASGPSGMAMAMSMTNATVNQQIQVLLLGLFNFGGSVVPGTRYYLSDTVPGGLVTTAPTTAGHIVQPIGFGIDTNSIWFNPVLNPTTN